VLRWLCDSPRTGCAWRITPLCKWREQAIIEWSRRWTLLLLAATVRSSAHMPLGISDRNSSSWTSQEGCCSIHARIIFGVVSDITARVCLFLSFTGCGSLLRAVFCYCWFDSSFVSLITEYSGNFTPQVEQARNQRQIIIGTRFHVTLRIVSPYICKQC